MKISVVGPTYPFRGGISHYNTLLCDHLSKTHQVHPISFRRLYPSFLYPGQTLKDETSKKTLTLDNLDYPIDCINPLTWVKTSLEIRRQSPDLLIFHWWTPFLAFVYFTVSSLVKKLTNTKILFICHNVLPHERTPIDKYFSKIAFRNTDFFIVHSEEDLENLKAFLPNALVKQTVLPSFDIFRFGEELRDKSKNRLGLNGTTVLFFGIVRKYKGLMYLVQAMPKILMRLDATLLVVGEFWDSKDKYLECIRRLGIKNNVRIIDRYVPNEEVALYFSAADLVVLPYVSATQSAIVQIAYRFNKPVITTNVGGLPDVVENEKTGLVVEPRNSDAIADAIISYFDDGKEATFVENIKKVKTKFSWDNVSATIEELTRGCG